jgi:glycosyltransferase involved in cell wall biosynthesis
MNLIKGSYMISENQTSCIIPFWNEGNRIFDVLDEILKVRNLSEIICVDDASQDCNHMEIYVRYPGIKLVRLQKNLGKAGAVREGLKHASCKNILLADADLLNLNHKEIEKAIDAFMISTDLDMLILRRINAIFFLRLYRADILFTGERILRKSDLEKILDESEASGWQLESAINTWMFLNNRKVEWIAHSAINRRKYLKWGFLKGLTLDLKTYSDMITATGFSNIVKQIALFAKKEYKADNMMNRKKNYAPKELEEVN